MTALNQNYTTEYNLQTGPRRLPAGQFDADYHQAQFRDTVITGQGTVNALILPAGNIRIFRDPTRISNENTAWANAANLVIGYAAYVDNTGATISAVANAFLTSTAMNAARDLAPTLGTGILFVDFNTQNGLTITLGISANDKATNDILNVLIAFAEIGYGT